MVIDTRVDGVKVVSDPAYVQRIFSFGALITGATMNTLNTVQTAAIVYTGLYPRIVLIYLTGAKTLANTEIAITSLTATDRQNGMWWVDITMMEKSQ